MAEHETAGPELIAPPIGTRSIGKWFIVQNSQTDEQVVT
jgi:hypothetical protein